MRKSECVVELSEAGRRLDNDPYVNDQMSFHHGYCLVKEWTRSGLLRSC
jgi:hypothetical protein